MTTEIYNKINKLPKEDKEIVERYIFNLERQLLGMRSQIGNLRRKEMYRFGYISER